MQNYTVMVDRFTDNNHPHLPPTYMIAICPSNLAASAMATTSGLSPELCGSELRRYFGFTEAAIDRFFSSKDPQANITLTDQPLSDDDAKHFNWP